MIKWIIKPLSSNEFIAVLPSWKEPQLSNTLTKIRKSAEIKFSIAYKTKKT